MKHKTILTGLTGCILITATAMAQPNVSSRYDFMKLEYPGSVFSYPLGINDRREIAGVYADATMALRGFLWKEGRFTKIDFPGALGTGPGGINNRGDIAGTYFGQDGFQHGFLRARPAWCEDDDDQACAPVFTTIDDPAAVQTQGIPFEFGPGLGTAAIGINNHGVMTGMYAPGVYSDGFIRSHGGAFTPVDHPSASHLPGFGTKCFAVADTGVAACDYLTLENGVTPISHGFLLDDGHFVSIEVPGSIQAGFGTQVNGVNDHRMAVGIFSSLTGGHGLLWVSGNYFTVDYAGKPFSELHSINDRGDLTGAYSDDPLGRVLHGFVAFPKDR